MPGKNRPSQVGKERFHEQAPRYVESVSAQEVEKCNHRATSRFTNYDDPNYTLARDIGRELADRTKGNAKVTREILHDVIGTVIGRTRLIDRRHQEFPGLSHDAFGVAKAFYYGYFYEPAPQDIIDMTFKTGQKVSSMAPPRGFADASRTTNGWLR